MGKIKVVEVFMNSQKVGRIVLTEDYLCAFEYDTEFLKTGFSISPYFLPLKPGLFLAKREPFRGNFGVFDDSLPDGWGNLILDRYLKERGIEAPSLTLLQRLSLVGTNGRGALEYFPDKSVASEDDFPDFDKLAAESQKILSSEYSSDMVDVFYQNGGSSGGARPKIFTKINGKGAPALKDILQVASEAEIPAKKANEIIESVVEICRSEHKLKLRLIQ
jgi:serine/threonine-protein kinase HipA